MILLTEDLDNAHQDNKRKHKSNSVKNRDRNLVHGTFAVLC